MRQLREFMGTITRMEYDPERDTFDSVSEVHPFLARGEAGDDPASSATTNGWATVSSTSDQPAACSEVDRPNEYQPLALAG